MAREQGSGGRKGRASGPKGKSSGGKKKSGWVKPDGTPLRKRKGDYFPDQEIDKRKPAQRSRFGAKPFNKATDDSNSDFSNKSDRPIRTERSERAKSSDAPRHGERSRTSEKSDDPRHGERSRTSEKSDAPHHGERSRTSERSDAPRHGERSRTTERNERASSRGSDRDTPFRNKDTRQENDRGSELPVRSERTGRPGRAGRDAARSEYRGRPDRNEKPGQNDRGDRGDSRTPYKPKSDRPTRPGKSSYADYKSRGDRDDRPERSERDDSSSDIGNNRPIEKANDRRDTGRPEFKKKPFEKKRERYADRDHSKEMRGRFDKKPGTKDFKRRESFKSKSAKAAETNEAPGAVRLNKFIANAGICSRREADDLITAGVISVNGVVVTELGTKVLPGDEVKYNDQALRTEKMVYVLLNKPKDYITTTDDPEERKTVMNLVHDAGKERIFPVGRLDRNTTGLLLLTNDGELTKRLTHPSGNIKKIYQVELDRNLTQEDMVRAADGVELEDGPASVDEIHYDSPAEKNIVGVELHSGRNRVVRRIFEAMDYKVRKLDRVYFAGLTKKDLPRGRWRFLTELEVNMLMMLTGKKKK